MSDRTSIPMTPSRRVLAALALFALALAAALAAAPSPANAPPAEEAEQQPGQPPGQRQAGTGPVHPPRPVSGRDPGTRHDPAADRRSRRDPRHEVHVRQLSGLRREGRGGHERAGEMWSYVFKKTNPRCLWHAIDHHTGKVLAYVFGRRKDNVFLKLQQLSGALWHHEVLHGRMGRLRAAYRSQAAPRGEGKHAENREQTH